MRRGSGGESSGVSVPKSDSDLNQECCIMETRSRNCSIEDRQTTRPASQITSSNKSARTANVLSVSYPVAKTESFQLIADSAKGEIAQITRTRAIAT